MATPLESNALQVELDEWSKDLSRFEDDGIDPPTKTAVRMARSFAGCIPNECSLPRMVPMGDGGISIAWYRSTDDFTRFEISDIGEIEAVVLEGGRVKSRWRIEEQATPLT